MTPAEQLLSRTPEGALWVPLLLIVLVLAVVWMRQRGR